MDDNDGPVETWGDHGRACAVEGCIGLVVVGARHALVLGDEPAMTTYLATERVPAGVAQCHLAGGGPVTTQPGMSK